VLATLLAAAGARQFCAIRSYLSTRAKHGLTFFDALIMLSEGQPWMPAAV
jgi:transposase